MEDSLRKKKEKLQAAEAKGDSKRVARLERKVRVHERTKNYNLNTALKNYIDPRCYKAWCDYVGLDWAKVYSTSLQRKFSWVAQASPRWEAFQEPALKPVVGARRPSESSP